MNKHVITPNPSIFRRRFKCIEHTNVICSISSSNVKQNKSKRQTDRSIRFLAVYPSRVELLRCSTYGSGGVSSDGQPG